MTRVAGRVAAVACLVLATAPFAHAGRWLGSLEAGYESYTERYSIADDDTLSSVDEFRSRARLAYAAGLFGRDYTLVEARAMVGESSWDAAARAMLTRRFGEVGRHALNLDAEIMRRGFREGSTYEFPNDYTRGTARAGLRARATPSLTVRAEDRFEILDYDQRTEFDYDYVKNHASLAADVSRDPTRGVLAGVRYTTFVVPDSAEIEYDAWIPFAEVRAFDDLHERVLVSASVERRTYPDDGTRSSFWAVVVALGLEWSLHRHWSIEMIDDLEDYAYDEETGAYHDYVENAAAILLNFNTAALQVGAGPAFGWLNSDTSPDDEYRELGVRVVLEMMGGSGWWVSASYEPGLRDYPSYQEGDPVADLNAVFSDYSYHRVGLFANARVWQALWLNVFLDYQPEDHEREDDDATATIASVNLTLSL
ncbi:MAG: hypothetical protein L0Z51_05790 [Candidatus Latescibacteria bacterium]|nr:hypothetical protein [Candidatus Latescibacterota bacterium]